MILLLLLLPLPLIPATSQQHHFDAVIVRGDLYTDWAVAMAYGITHGSWVMHLTADNEGEVLNLVSGFMRFRRGVNILIVGAPNAVPIEFEERLRGMGAGVKRIGGTTRFDTSLQLAIYYWNDCETIVLADGLNSTYYMAALSVAVEKGAPIIYTRDGNPPEGFETALKDYLRDAKSIVVIGNSLSREWANRLISEGYGVEFMGEIGSTGPFSGGWSLTYLVRALNPLPLLIGFIIGSSAILLFFRLRPKRESYLMDFFTVDERKLIEVILERGEVAQEELPDLTGFSKPKISRLLKDLVDRKVVERRKYGKTYLVRVTDRFRSL